MLQELRMEFMLKTNGVTSFVIRNQTCVVTGSCAKYVTVSTAHRFKQKKNVKKIECFLLRFFEGLRNYNDACRHHGFEPPLLQAAPR